VMIGYSSNLYNGYIALLAFIYIYIVEFKTFSQKLSNVFLLYILALEVLHQKANDISWTKSWRICCN